MAEGQDTLDVPVSEPERAIPPEVPPRPPFLDRQTLRLATAIVAVAAIVVLAVFAVFYVRLGHIIDRRLASGPFSNTLNIYTAPRTVAVGDKETPEEIALHLKRSGYSTSTGNAMGWYRLTPATIEVFPGRSSLAGGEPGVIEFAKGRVSRIVSLGDHTTRETFALEPELISNLSSNREVRRLVHFADIPPNLVQAVISAEDKHFFQHSGFDLFRIAKAAWVDLRDGRKAQGASTLTMQLARDFWLDPDKRWTRKAAELLIAMHLEHKLTKQQIFEDYANEVYLGRSGTLSINGFGEAARAFFWRDLSQLDVAEAAMLAGLVQRPSFYNPYRYPDRARERRDTVLGLMRQNGYLTAEQYQQALASPVRIAAEESQSQEGQYFIDLMNQEIPTKLEDREKQARTVFTTLDPDLQRAAEESVRMGMKAVDQTLHKRKSKTPIPAGQPQVALVALDPHTGEIKALVGGRDYRTSQLNRVLALRQPGSVFKPFVYAAALETALQGGSQIFTPASLIDDTPSTFYFRRDAYTPGNFRHDFMGDVTLRTALAHSLNVATVELAQEVGYDRVVKVARRAGLNDRIQPTPSVALGAYETTPLEMAGAYTVFANQGVRVQPTTLALVRARDGAPLFEREARTSPALDPRVAYLTVSLMQEVLRTGTGAGVRARGFNLPAAGKTGTSRDGWFAGFTSQLLCVVWVGFDDNRDLKLEGAHSALPIWTEFMKRAAKLRDYRDAHDFTAPSGIVTAEICPESGQLAGRFCPDDRTEVFIDGTQPVVQCELHGGQWQIGAADRLMQLSPIQTVVPSAVPPVLGR